MEWLLGIIKNPFLAAGVSAWIIAQILKFVIHSVVNRKVDIQRLFGDGGMPSGHSATVTALAVMAALIYGTSSFQFAISAILALVVCHDAMGIRREAGKQAVAIKEIMKALPKDGTNFAEEKLKEFIGHTPLQVIVGGLLGALDAAMLYWIVF